MNSSSPTKEDLRLFTLTNKNGIQVKILNLGASIYNLMVPDKDGNLQDIVVTPKLLKTYVSEEFFNEKPSFGASIGRYAGRITAGKFLLEGRLYQLNEKNGVHLHGGFRGFQDKIWKIVSEKEESSSSVTFSYFSEDGEEGYPGNLTVMVTYTLTENNEFHISYTAETDKETPVNLTNHSYFNLNGGGSVSNHILKIAANSILETDDKLLPTGNFIPLGKTEKDFSKAKKIGELPVDDTYILNGDRNEAVKIYSGETGIQMEVQTNQPATVIYIPEQISDEWEYQTTIGKRFPSVCFEMQNFPDTPNHPNFPNSILSPGEKYRNEIVFRFFI